MRVDDSLGPWLYGVSRRVASKARIQAGRRKAREGGRIAAEPFLVRSPEDDERRELLAALDEEVARLPEPFRSVVILCDLEGENHETAAKKLGCPVGTIESRLSRGRKRLRERLNRRGLSPTGAAAVGLIRATLPESLFQSTFAFAFRTSVVSRSVSFLIQGALMEMAFMKIKMVSLILVGVAAAYGLSLAVGQGTEKSSQPAVVKLAPPPKAKPGDFLMIEVLEALPGRPITGERLVRPDGTISLGFYGDLQVAGLTRSEVKEKVVRHMQKFLTDEAVGLVTFNEVTNKQVSVPAAESVRIFVDDGVNVPDPRLEARSREVSETLDRILKAVEKDRKPEKPKPDPSGKLAPPAKAKPGDFLRIEVLEALPGRPIFGIRVVRPDGTISLGVYGDLSVAGLTRTVIKVKVIERLKKYLTDNALGLLRIESETDVEKLVPVDPADSDRVFVDDGVDLEVYGNDPQEIKASLNRIIHAVEPARASPRLRSLPNADYDRRLDAIEKKLDRLVEAMEKGGAKK